MAKNLNDALNHPDFWAPDTTDDDRKFALSQADKTFASKPPSEQDSILANFAKTRQKSQAREQQDRQQREQNYAPKVQQQQTWFQSAVAPLTEAVGRGVEMATNPLVTAARYAQGEPLAAQTTEVPGTGMSYTREGALAGGPVGAGGVAGQTRTRVASNIVPQSPWQAGAIGAQFIPGVGQAGTLARVGAAAGGAGLLQGLLGEKGLAEGGSLGEAGKEAGIGMVKGGATQAAGETLGKFMGVGARHTPGLGTAVNNAEARKVAKGAAELSPELAGAGRTSADIGTFYKMGGAEEAIGNQFKNKLGALERELTDIQGHPYIDTNELRVAYKAIAKGADPVAKAEVDKLAPTPFGFTPEQVAEIVSLTRERMTKGEGTSLLFRHNSVKNLVSSIEASLPPSAQGIFSAGRAAVAKGSAIQELLASAFKPSNKGYQIDMPKLQTAISESPELANRLTQQGFGDLVQAVTRGATRKPGFADQPAGNWNFVPVSSTGVKATLLKHLLQRYRYVGQKPLTVPPGAKAGMGVAATQYAGSKSGD